MAGELMDALNQVARETDLSGDVLLDLLKKALVSAYRKKYKVEGEIEVEIDPRKAEFRVYSNRTVVEDDPIPYMQISLAEARKHDAELEVGDSVLIEVTPENFGRIAAQTAKQVIVQSIRETQRIQVFEEYEDKVHEVVTGTIQRREGRTVYVALGKIEGVLPANEQVPSESYRFGERMKFYVFEARRTPKGPFIILSRSHKDLVVRLFELEVPEISEGVVEIKSIAREAGARTKIAVSSKDPKVDPVGACVGQRGSRVQNVVNDIYGEKIDVVRWSDDPAAFIAAALSPAKAMNVQINESAKSAMVIAPDNMLSLAIGKEGQNVRLAARLTGWRIDIRSEAQLEEMKANGGLLSDTDRDAVPEDKPDDIDPEIASVIVDSVHPAKAESADTE